MSAITNQQKIFYSNIDGMHPIYNTDDDGNVIYQIIGGVRVPQESGEQELGYTQPKEAWVSIAGALANTAFQFFGVDASADKATISTPKGVLPVKKGSLIWKDSPIEYKYPNIEQEPLPESADYRVKDTNTLGLQSDLFLLEKLNKSE